MSRPPRRPGRRRKHSGPKADVLHRAPGGYGQSPGAVSVRPMAAHVALGCAILFPEGCSEMTPFEQHLQALADLWNQGGKAYLTAQQSMFTGMADTMAKASSVGDKARSRPLRRIRRLRGGAAGLLQAMVVGVRTLGRSDQEPARADQANPHVADMLAKISIPRLVLGHERSRSDA